MNPEGEQGGRAAGSRCASIRTHRRSVAVTKALWGDIWRTMLSEVSGGHKGDIDLVSAVLTRVAQWQGLKGRHGICTLP